MKRLLSLLAALLLVFPAAAALAESPVTEAVLANAWYQDERARLRVGNPTPMEGKFFTTLWGATTSDLDAQDLLHAASPVIWDEDLDRFRFDRSVVEDALVMDDAEGNRTYLLSLNSELCWSDGTPITPKDYAFSLLLQMDAAVAETGGVPETFSWLAGSQEYRSGKAKALSGVRLVADSLLQITVRADALPYFHELSRLAIHPYPIGEIAPGNEVLDDGEGVYLAKPLTAETLQEHVLDEKTGYLRHPRTVSGPYILEAFDGTVAKFAVNPYFKGTEAGYVPRIGRIEYETGDSAELLARLAEGSLDLVDKVTPSGTILKGLLNTQLSPDTQALAYEPRTGLAMVWFTDTSKKVQDTAVRQAIALCFDRDAFTQAYAGDYGRRMDGLYGVGQWMYRQANGLAVTAEELPEGATDEAREEYEALIEAWKSLSLDSLTTYEPSAGKARRRLEIAGWTLNETGAPFDPETDSLRCRETGGEITGLELAMAVPENPELLSALTTYLAAPLREAGIRLEIRTESMERIEAIYRGREESEYDLLFLGENFSAAFDPEILAPKTWNSDSELCQEKLEAYEIAREMLRTEPEDTLGYVKKWIDLQQRISETLPLLPVYSNVYFDFYTRGLHDYDILHAVSWGEAIVRSYMSDIEEQDEAEQEQVRRQLEEAQNPLGTPEPETETHE